MFTLNDEYTVDSRTMGNILRFANHSKNIWYSSTMMGRIYYVKNTQLDKWREKAFAVEHKERNVGTGNEETSLKNANDVNTLLLLLLI